MTMGLVVVVEEWLVVFNYLLLFLAGLVVLRTKVYI